MTEDVVQYAEIPGWPGYRIGSDGTVWTKKHWGGGRWRQLSTSSPSQRYPRVALCHNGKEQSVLVHKLLLESFVGPRPPGMQCLHIDGNRRNSVLSNLRWGTHMENVADKMAHGQQVVGEQVSTAKLTEHQVLEIRALFGSGVGVVELARRYRVRRHNIARIVYRRTWKHL